jgi:predicted secreted hydrolase
MNKWKSKLFIKILEYSSIFSKSSSKRLILESLIMFRKSIVLCTLFSLSLSIICGNWSAALAAPKVYKQALPGYQYKFPQDHYSHDQFRTEWWYYTGHLLTDDKRRFGYELTFFRTGADNEPTNKQSPWKLDNFYLAHFAVTDENGKKFRYTEKLNRSGLSLLALGKMPIMSTMKAGRWRKLASTTCLEPIRLSTQFIYCLIR